MRNDYGMRPRKAAGEGSKKVKGSGKMESEMKAKGSKQKPLKKEVVSGKMFSKGGMKKDCRK